MILDELLLLLDARILDTEKRILESLQSLHQKAGITMTQLSDLTDAVAKLQADVTTMTTAIAAEVVALNAEIVALQNANPTIDLSAVIASIATIDAAVTAATPVAPSA